MTGPREKAREIVEDVIPERYSAWWAPLIERIAAALDEAPSGPGRCGCRAWEPATSDWKYCPWCAGVIVRDGKLVPPGASAAKSSEAPDSDGRENHRGCWDGKYADCPWASIVHEIGELLTKLPCRHEGDNHAGTPPMMYAEWIACVVGHARDHASPASPPVAPPAPPGGASDADGASLEDWGVIGNHLANALIMLAGPDFPKADKSDADARAWFADETGEGWIALYDLWIGWRACWRWAQESPPTASPPEAHPTPPDPATREEPLGAPLGEYPRDARVRGEEH